MTVHDSLTMIPFYFYKIVDSHTEKKLFALCK